MADIDIADPAADVDNGDAEDPWFIVSLMPPSDAAVGYLGVLTEVLPLPLLPAKGLTLLDLKLRFPPGPGGTKNDMLDGVDIRLDGELLFRARGVLTLTIVTGSAGVLEWAARCDAGEAIQDPAPELPPFPKMRGLVGLLPSRLSEDLDIVGVDDRATIPNPPPPCKESAGVARRESLEANIAPGLNRAFIEAAG